MTTYLRIHTDAQHKCSSGSVRQSHGSRGPVSCGAVLSCAGGGLGVCSASSCNPPGFPHSAAGSVHTPSLPGCAVVPSTASITASKARASRECVCAIRVTSVGRPSKCKAKLGSKGQVRLCAYSCGKHVTLHRARAHAVMHTAGAGVGVVVPCAEARLLRWSQAQRNSNLLVRRMKHTRKVSNKARCKRDACATVCASAATFNHGCVQSMEARYG